MSETIRWLKQPQDHNYPAAQSYLSLVYDERTVREKIEALRRSCSLLGVSNRHASKDQKKIRDGYDRLCAVYTFDEDAEIPCKIV